MKKNVGGMDRGIRFAMGTSMLAIGLFGHVGIVRRLYALSMGVCGLFTASTRFCPLNEMLGLNSYGASRRLAQESIGMSPKTGEQVTPATAI